MFGRKRQAALASIVLPRSSKPEKRGGGLPALCSDSGRPCFTPQGADASLSTLSLTTDQDADNEEEMERITAAGVSPFSVWTRVWLTACYICIMSTQLRKPTKP